MVCLNFRLMFYTFHVVTCLVFALMLFLFVAYQNSRQNVLLRSFCCVMMVSYAIIEFGYVLLGKEPYNHPRFQDFSIVQSIVLNYCFLSAQAHSACMMVNSCLLALGWRFGQWERYIDRSLLFLFLSYGLPVIPTLTLGMMIPDLARYIIYSFYAFVPGNLLFLCYTFWLLLCAIPGNIATIYLVYETIKLRRQTLRISKHTQITLFQLFRILLATVIYMTISIGSAIPFFFLDPEKYRYPDDGLSMAVQMSPWTNPNLCCLSHQYDQSMAYYARVRCPSLLSYLPALMGLGIFLMYGFSSPIYQAAKKFGAHSKKIVSATGRRLSSASCSVHSKESSNASYQQDEYLETVMETDETFSCSTDSHEGRTHMRRKTAPMGL